MSVRVRVLSGFFLGLVIMLGVVQVFTPNRFDFDNMQRGVRLVLEGVNPWAAQTRIPHYYNPPFAVIFLWPLLIASPEVMVVIGGALLFALVFYLRAWTALAFFATNSFLFLVAAGGIDMFVIGGGLLLLAAGNRLFQRWSGLALRVLAFGLLLVKPQGTIFIVGLYLLLRRDWRGGLVAALVYGLPFIHLYPDWLHILLTDPPSAQAVAAHTLMGKFGPWVAALAAGVVIFARRWRYWQLGGALAGILSPYGMPGMPIFLVYTAIPNPAVIPIIILFSALLASITWVTPPFPVPNLYAYINPLMSIYHLSMLANALLLACYAPRAAEQNEAADWIDARGWMTARVRQVRALAPGWHAPPRFRSRTGPGG